MYDQCVHTGTGSVPPHTNEYTWLFPQPPAVWYAAGLKAKEQHMRELVALAEQREAACKSEIGQLLASRSAMFESSKAAGAVAAAAAAAAAEAAAAAAAGPHSAEEDMDAVNARIEAAEKRMDAAQVR
jgi:hypothetical protein